MSSNQNKQAQNYINILLATIIPVQSLYSLVTWRQKTEKLMALVRRGGRHNNKDTNKSQSYSTNIKSLSEPKESRKTNKKGLSKSISNLKELNNSVDVARSSSKTRGKKMGSKSASCSALNLPLPTEPGEKTEKGESGKANNTERSIYDDSFQASLYVKENVAYAANAEEKTGRISVAGMVDKINRGPEQGHDYEQLEIVQSSKF